MTLEDLEARLKTLESEVRTLKDIDAIKTLQRAYGYYLEHWMSQEVIDCFSDSPEVTLALYEGTWLGKDSVKRYFTRENISPEFIHQVMQLSPIVDIDHDGFRGRGRWYSWGAVAAPLENGVRRIFMGGIYECEYIREGGIWKILKLQYSLQISADPRDGWVSPEKAVRIDPKAKRKYQDPRPDIAPNGMDTRYPSGFIFPFHYKHPVTGKETSEAVRNDSLKFVPNRFAEE